MHTLRPACTLLLLLLILIGIYPHSANADQPMDEAALKALIIKKLPAYVIWPSTPAKPAVFSAFSPSPLRDFFTLSTQRAPSNHPPKLLRWPAPSAQVLICNTQDARKIGATVRRLQNTPILTVSDHPNFAQLGGMIQLVHKNQKIRLLINREAVSEAGLRISSRLLRLADVYKEAN